MNETEIKEKLASLMKGYNYVPKYQVEVMGKQIDVPVKYSDARALMGLFPISTEKAEKLLGTKRLKPVSILNGKSLFGVTVFDYIDCPVGPYREIALSIPVMLDSKVSVPFLPLLFDSVFKKFGFYTILLAMNTDIAREHSEKIFGYPTYNKNVEIDIRKEKEYIYVDSKEGAEKIMSLKIKTSDNFRTTKRKHNTYFIKDSKIINVELYSATHGTQGRNNLILDLGNHEISNIVSALSIEPTSLIDTHYAHAIEILDSPKDLGDL